MKLHALTHVASSLMENALHFPESRLSADLGLNSMTTNWLQQLKKGLSKTRAILTTDIDELFTGKQNVDDELLEELEELLITSDIGVSTTMDLIESISKTATSISNAEELKLFLKNEISKIINTKPFVKAEEIGRLDVAGYTKKQNRNIHIPLFQ